MDNLPTLSGGKELSPDIAKQIISIAGDDKAKLEGILGVFQLMQPNDGTESLIVLQMAQCHLSALSYANQLGKGGSLDGQEVLINCSTKLSRTFTSLLGGLIAYRASQSEK